jgi:hypothetical protein
MLNLFQHPISGFKTILVRNPISYHPPQTKKAQVALLHPRPIKLIKKGICTGSY